MAGSKQLWLTWNMVRSLISRLLRRYQARHPYQANLAIRRLDKLVLTTRIKTNMARSTITPCPVALTSLQVQPVYVTALVCLQLVVVMGISQSAHAIPSARVTARVVTTGIQTSRLPLNMEIYTIPIRTADSPDKYILYRPLAGLAFVGNKAMVAQTTNLMNDKVELASHQNTATAFLRQIGFLEPDPAPPASMQADFLPTMAVLLLTNQCQLRCTYCYAAAGESARQELSVDLGKTAIDHVCKNAQALGKSGFEVSFHGGGEPTLAWQTMEACVMYARQKPLPAKLTLQSNGLWPEKKREWLLNNFDSLSLSMDGSPTTQDRQRPRVSGRGSSRDVMQTIQELDKRKFAYGIRMTATAPWENFPRDVQYICESTQCPSLQVEPAFNTKRGGHGNPNVEEARAFAQAFLEAFDIATKAGRELVYSGARLGKVTSAFCMAPYDALIVSGNGTLVTCYEVTSASHDLAKLSNIGQVEGGQIHVDHSARKSLHAKMAQRRTMCRDCFCYWSCAGDCYARTFDSCDEGYLQYGARCETNRYILEGLLLDAIAEGEGVWFDPVRHFPPASQTPPPATALVPESIA